MDVPIYSFERSVPVQGPCQQLIDDHTPFTPTPSGSYGCVAVLTLVA